ncbi:MAG: histidine--tRNA ligase [Sandaracinaceae bacterium]|nr:histidine--tRNA ligase [Sandaracinaceae bacterium]
MGTLQAVKGMNDVLGEETPRWQRLEARFRERTALYGYEEVRTPIVEPTALFLRSIGETTDIVEKEMYTFADKGDATLTLRPEGTASAVRAYLEHTVYAKQPVTKWTYTGAMFRRERPAKGRYRQFHQAGAEVYGDPGPYVDAEMIDMIVAFLADIGIRDIEVLVNSLGGPETRPAYTTALVAYLSPLRASLCGDCQRRIDTNPLRVLDCKVEHDRAVAAQAPSVVEFLTPADKEHFDNLQRTLDALGTPYRVEPRLVRGLDYYTRTLFEVKGRGGGLGAQDTVCGGGRYDGLVEQLGGQSTPAIGFAMGIERLLMMMEQPVAQPNIDVFIIAASPAELVEATKIARDLRQGGVRTDADLRGQSMKSQMRRADKSGARLALVVGSDEVTRSVVQLKDLIEKTQTEVPRADLLPRVRATLALVEAK